MFIALARGFRVSPQIKEVAASVAILILFPTIILGLVRLLD